MNLNNTAMPGSLGQMAAQPFIDGYVEMVKAVVEAAKREGVFEELDRNPEFQKSWKEYLASEKGTDGLKATNEALTNDLMSVLLEDELGYRNLGTVHDSMTSVLPRPLPHRDGMLEYDAFGGDLKVEAGGAEWSFAALDSRVRGNDEMGAKVKSR